MISVIIPTSIGGMVHLTRLMPFLSKEPNKEIVVVDNNSMDGTTNYLANYECKIVVNKTPKNFSESNNIGASIAKGEYLLFMNNDTRPNEGLLDQMQKTFQLDEKIGVVGCLLYLMDPPHKIQHAGVMFTDQYIPYELGLPLSFGVPEIAKNDPRIRATREVPSVTAACMMVKREVFDELGGFDEGYIFGWEDTDFVLRAREKGYKVFYTGENFAYHKHSGSKDRGRFKFETQNRERYERLWVTNGRAKSVLKEFIYG